MYEELFNQAVALKDEYANQCNVLTKEVADAAEQNTKSAAVAVEESGRLKSQLIECRNQLGVAQDRINTLMVEGQALQDKYNRQGVAIKELEAQVAEANKVRNDLSAAAQKITCFEAEAAKQQAEIGRLTTLVSEQATSIALMGPVAGGVDTTAAGTMVADATIHNELVERADSLGSQMAAAMVIVKMRPLEVGGSRVSFVKGMALRGPTLRV